MNPAPDHRRGDSVTSLTWPGFFSRESQKLIHGHLGREDADHIALAVENGIDSRPRKGMEIHLHIRIKEPGCVWRGIRF